MRPIACFAGALLSAFILHVLGTSPQADPADDAERRLERLRSLPYTSTTAEEADPETAGVLVYEANRAWKGYNLYCCSLCPDVMLMDMEGTIIHRWARPDSLEGQFQHAILLPDAGSVAISTDPYFLIRLDSNSNPLWKKDISCHHDVTLTPDNTLYVIVDEKLPDRGLLAAFPLVLELTLDGEEIGRWSACEHLDDMKSVFDTSSFLDTILNEMLAQSPQGEVAKRIVRQREARPLEDGGALYDYFHMNTVSVMPETPLGAIDPMFRPGNMLTCFKHVNQIAILDKDTGETMWSWGEGILQWPHHPTVLENGNILVFDNGSQRRFSRVIELDPSNKTIEWDYTADPPRGFFSYARGSAQRLPNGNTLICEGDKGRAFEVTAKGEIVWDWLNPVYQAGRRAQVYRMIRLAPRWWSPF